MHFQQSKFKAGEPSTWPRSFEYAVFELRQPYSRAIYAVAPRGAGAALAFSSGHIPVGATRTLLIILRAKEFGIGAPTCLSRGRLAAWL